MPRANGWKGVIVLNRKNVIKTASRFVRDAAKNVLMLELHHIGVILLAVAIYAALSRRIELSVVTMPMVFTLFGFLIGQGGIEIVPMEAEHEFIHTIAEITLILVLFSDASRVNFKALKQNVGIPARMLLIGMPLTIAAGTYIAHWVSPEAPLVTALLVAAILTPTDAALGQAVVSSTSVPERIRQGINVESGLNDGLALPIVIVAALASVEAMGAHVEDAPENVIFFIAQQLVLGPLTGVIIGGGGAFFLNWCAERALATTAYQGVYFLVAAFLCFIGAELIGGNGFIGAFIGGLTFGNVFKANREFIGEFMESEGQILTIFTFLIFGAAMAPVGLEHASWKTLSLAIAFLTLVRIVPIFLSLTGTGLSFYEKFFLGWFGPRGLASILFALLILERFPLPNGEEILACVVMTVLISIFAHGVSATPMAKKFSSR